MALLELRKVSRRFGEVAAVQDVSLSIDAGEFFTLLGPSGCGRTTILRMIAGFDAPNSGKILFDGASLSGVPPERRPLHTVFQSYVLFTHMSVAENIAFPLEMVGVVAAERRRRVAETLALVWLEGKGGHYPGELSGGKKRRKAGGRDYQPHGLNRRDHCLRQLCLPLQQGRLECGDKGSVLGAC